ncbi:hypothetical protein BH23GEM6_BH23GEM6_11730 [soil metagenome]
MRRFPLRPVIVLVLLLAFVTACRSVLQPEATLPVDFIYGINRLQTEPAFQVETHPDSVMVRGYLRTPCQPYNATASAEIVASSLVLRVSGGATGRCPQDVVASVGYQATVQIAPSAYTHLQVVHQWRDASWPPETVVDTVLAR